MNCADLYPVFIRGLSQHIPVKTCFLKLENYKVIVGFCQSEIGGFSLNPTVNFYAYCSNISSPVGNLSK